MNQKGFAFIETIITVVVLSTTLLALYTSFNSIIRVEEERLYYDDVAYIYKTKYVRDFLEENTDIENVKALFSDNEYVRIIGESTGSLFTDDQKNANIPSLLTNIKEKYHISIIVLVKSAMLDDCLKCDSNSSTEECAKCTNAMEHINDLKLKSYINKLNSREYDYYLVVEYGEKYNESGELTRCNPNVKDPGCNAFFVSLGI